MGVAPLARSPSAFVVLELELRLGRCQTRHRDSIRRAGDVIEIAGAKETDRIGIAAVFAAHADFQFLVCAAAAFRMPEKLVAANADSRPIPSACAISASTSVVGSPHA